MPGRDEVPRAARRVRGGQVELQRGALELVGDPGQVLAGGGHVEADHVRAVAGEHRGDRGADATGRAGDDRGLADQRLVPVLGDVDGGRADPDDLPDTYAERPDSRNRIVDSIASSAPGAT